MSYAKGARRPDPVKLAAHPKAEAHPSIAARLLAHASGAAPLPSSADKVPRTPEQPDQGQSGHCTTASTTAAIWQSCAAKGQPLPWYPSQQVGYAGVRAKEGAWDPPGSDTLGDTGAEINDVWSFYREFGLRAMKVAHSPDGRFDDVWSAADVQGIASAPAPNLGDQPDPADLEQSSETFFGIDIVAATIDPAASNRSDLMAAALDASPPIPLEVCGFVDTAFEELAADAVAGAPNQNDPQGGGHAFRINAYRTNAAGAREFRVDNTWGRGWASGGSGWVGEAFCAAAWSIQLVDVNVKVGAA